MLKVFRLNECDWIAASSQEEAIKWYMNETGLDYEDAVDGSFLEECNLDKNKMWVHYGYVSQEEIEQEKYEVEDFQPEPCTYIPFRRVLEIENRSEPYFFCSTEY